MLLVNLQFVRLSAVLAPLCVSALGPGGQRRRSLVPPGHVRRDGIRVGQVELQLSTGVVESLCELVFVDPTLGTSSAFNPSSWMPVGFAQERSKGPM